MSYYFGMVAFFGLIAAQVLAVVAHEIRWDQNDQQGCPEAAPDVAHPEPARPRKLATV